MSWLNTFTWVAETIHADLFRAWPDVPLPGCPCPLCRGLREEAARTGPGPAGTARRDQAAEAYRARRCAEMASREAAEASARDLLLSCLDAEQARQFQGEGCFEVTARPSGHRYLIEAGWYSNITCVYGPEAGRHYCIVAHIRESWVPLHDQLLMQKLVIEADEPRFLRTAY